MDASQLIYEGWEQWEGLRETRPLSDKLTASRCYLIRIDARPPAEAVEISSGMQPQNVCVPCTPQLSEAPC